MNYDEAIKNFSYDSMTGELKRVTRKNSDGSIDQYGYKIIKFKGIQFKSHRVCWLIHYGSFPCNVIDHINGDKTDNRIENLRDVAQALNVRNRADSGIYVDNTTNGLVAKYTVRSKDKTRRFRDYGEAIACRKQIDAEMGVIRRPA